MTQKIITHQDTPELIASWFFPHEPGEDEQRADLAARIRTYAEAAVADPSILVQPRPPIVTEA